MGGCASGTSTNSEQLVKNIGFSVFKYMKTKKTSCKGIKILLSEIAI